MKILSSLRSRIFLASALLAMLCISVAIYLVNQRVTEEAERTLEREIVTTAAQVDQLRAERTQTFALMARVPVDAFALSPVSSRKNPCVAMWRTRGASTRFRAALVACCPVSTSASGKRDLILRASSAVPASGAK
jgi:hypothetical protein